MIKSKKIFGSFFVVFALLSSYNCVFGDEIEVLDGNSLEISDGNNSVLKIATKIVKPFVFRHDSSSEWDGFSIDFMKLVLPQMTNYTSFAMYEYADNNAIFQNVLNGNADIGHASITKNQEREMFIDFSHTFFDSGFQVMVHNNLDVAASTAKFLSNFFTTVLLQGVIAFIIIWFICSLLIWIVDYLYSGGKNVRSLFRPEFGIGIRQAMIWTVSKFGGKGVDTPRNRIGIALSFLYDIIGIFIKALITAGITVVLSQNTSTPKINGVDDLPGNTVGTVVATTSQDYLESIVGITMRNYGSVDDMFEGFYAQEVDALVYDYPILIFNLQQRQIQLGLDDAKIVGEIFEAQPYGIAIKPGNERLRENLNQAVLAVMGERNDYDRIYNKWFSFNDDSSISNTDFEVSFIFLGGLGAFFLALLLLIFCCYKIKQYRDVRQTHEDINIRDMIKNERSWKKKIELLKDDVEDDKYLSNSGMNEKGFLITRDIQEMLFQLNDNIEEISSGGYVKPLVVNRNLLRRKQRISLDRSMNRTLKERHNLSLEDRSPYRRKMMLTSSEDGSVGSERGSEKSHEKVDRETKPSPDSLNSSDVDAVKIDVDNMMNKIGEETSGKGIGEEGSDDSEKEKIE